MIFIRTITFGKEDSTIKNQKNKMMVYGILSNKNIS